MRWRRCGFDPWVGKIPCSRKWQPTPVFLPGKFYWQTSMVGSSPWGCRESDTTAHACTRAHTHTPLFIICRVHIHTHTHIHTHPYLLYTHTPPHTLIYYTHTHPHTPLFIIHTPPHTLIYYMPGPILPGSTGLSLYLLSSLSEFNLNQVFSNRPLNYKLGHTVPYKLSEYFTFVALQIYLIICLMFITSNLHIYVFGNFWIKKRFF